MTNPPIKAGIDLGTSNSVIAIIGPDGLPLTVLNAEGEATTPSIVHVEPDGTLIVGSRALDYPMDTARTFKRVMGRDNTIFPLASRQYTPEDLSAAVLKKLVADAVARLGAPIEQVVISVPYHFGVRERMATLHAAKQANLTVMEMVNEPVAAAEAYTHRRQFDHGYVFVFDLGGGTFDATLLEVGEKGAFVRGTSGSTSLGGQNFTDEITRVLIEQYTKAFTTPPDEEARHRLSRLAEQAKLDLSRASALDLPLTDKHGNTSIFHLTRTAFEQLITMRLEEIRVILEIMLETQNLRPRDVHKVLLIGGSTRVPAIRTMLIDIFGREPDESIDADQAVAWGAALAASAYGYVRVIKQIVNHGVGIKAWDAEHQRFMVEFILPAGHPFNVWSEPHAFTPNMHHQERITLEVRQGDIPEISASALLGELHVPLPQPAIPEQTQIQIKMRLNQSGLLEVEVTIDGQAPFIGEIKLHAR